MSFLVLKSTTARSAALACSRSSRNLSCSHTPARFAAWYEMFPRSAVSSRGQVEGSNASHGTFTDAACHLPRLAELGFDVVYLPPIHPIGTTFRKGKNNALNPEPDDVGSPWAIGNSAGGHTAIEPRLGTLADFDQFVRTAKDLGLEIALDYALQLWRKPPLFRRVRRNGMERDFSWKRSAEQYAAAYRRIARKG